MKPAQLRAAAEVLQGYFPESKLCFGAMFLEALDAFESAADPKKKTTKTDEAPGFAEFYTAYPRRIARRGAAQAYRAALERSTPELILAGAKRYAATVGATEQKYIKHPATWLRNDCWKDELGQMELVSTAFEDATEAGWVRRLEVFTGKTDSPRGTWRQAWGPAPKQDGCKVPESAKKAYLNQYPPKSSQAS